MVVIVILGIFVLLFFLVRYKGKKNLEANIAAEQHDVFEEMASFQNTIDYHGTTYQYRKDIVNILCIGVDKEEAMWERDDDGGSVGQADAVFLVSLDFEHSNIRILAIPRDTMVSIVACDENGNEMGAFTGQLALQYAYADGQEKSCSLVIGQVADILKNEVPINGYVAMNLSCIGTVNDAVGGVTVEMDDDYTLYNAKFKKGATVHLQGEEAQEFVQGRDITVSGSAYSRIGRQKRYLKAFISQAKKTLAQNPTLAVNLMSQLSDYMLTDISTDEVLYISTELSGCNFDEENMQILQGNIQMGEQYEEYYLDDEAVQNVEAVICNNDDMALGVYDYYKEKNLKLPVIIGINNSEEMHQKIMSGEMYGTIDNKMEDQVMEICRLMQAILKKDTGSYQKVWYSTPKAIVKAEGTE